MYSSLIGKVQKSQIYAQEKERVIISDLKATFQGDHDTYELKYEAGSWHCWCKNFVSELFCSHTMAIEKMMEGLAPGGAI